MIAGKCGQSLRDFVTSTLHGIYTLKWQHLAGLRAGRAPLAIVTGFGGGTVAILLSPFHTLLSASAP